MHRAHHLTKFCQKNVIKNKPKAKIFNINHKTNLTKNNYFESMS